MASLGGVRLQAVELYWPTWGGWWARCATEVGTVPAGVATLTVGDLSLVGTVLAGRFGEAAPSEWSAIARGGAAWDTVLPPRPAYQSDDGVRLKTVLADLARECRAAIVQPVDAPLGTYHARPLTGPTGRPWTGKDELDALVRARVLAGWWTDALDVTRVGARPGGVVTADAREQPGVPTRGLRVVGVDSVAAFAPGKIWKDGTIRKMVIRETGETPPLLELWAA